MTISGHLYLSISVVSIPHNECENRIYPAAASKKHTLTLRIDFNLKIKGWKKIFPANGIKKQASIVFLISNKIDFKPKLIRRHRGKHHILIKGKIHQHDITILNIYAPNIKAPKFVKKKNKTKQKSTSTA